MQETDRLILGLVVLVGLLLGALLATRPDHTPAVTITTPAECTTAEQVGTEHGTGRARP